MLSNQIKSIVHALLVCCVCITNGYAVQQEKTQFTIALDIGHTPKKHGATSARGQGEYIFNKRIVSMLHKKLLEQGFTNTFIVNPQGKEISLQERTQQAKKRHTDLFISIHHDSVNEKYLKTWTYNNKKRPYSDNFKGYSLFISDKHKQNRVIADIVGQTLRENHFQPTLHHAEKIKGENRKLLDADKGIYEFSQLIVLKTNAFATLLVECGIILNRDEEKLLISPDYQSKLSSALATAITHYYDTLSLSHQQPPK